MNFFCKLLNSPCQIPKLHPPFHARQFNICLQLHGKVDTLKNPVAPTVCNINWEGGSCFKTEFRCFPKFSTCCFFDELGAGNPASQHCSWNVTVRFTLSHHDSEKSNLNCRDVPTSPNISEICIFFETNFHPKCWHSGSKFMFAIIFIPCSTTICPCCLWNSQSQPLRAAYISFKHVIKKQRRTSSAQHIPAQTKMKMLVINHGVKPLHGAVFAPMSWRYFWLNLCVYDCGSIFSWQPEGFYKISVPVLDLCQCIHNETNLYTNRSATGTQRGAGPGNLHAKNVLYRCSSVVILLHGFASLRSHPDSKETNVSLTLASPQYPWQYCLIWARNYNSITFTPQRSILFTGENYVLLFWF